jgi:DNA-binding NtrC family response regulator
VTEARDGDAVSGLLSEVRSAGNFEDGARALLKRLLERAAQALAQSQYQGQGRIIRGMVHLRPDGEYRALAVYERGEGAAAATPASLLPSTTAWRWVSSSGKPVAVDVMLGQVQGLGGTSQVAQDPSLAGDLGRMNESRGRLLGRDATHVCALPLRGVRGAVEGMVSLEAECKAALGRPFVWEAALGDLQLFCDAAAPHLSQLPGQAKPAPAGDVEDPLLPVIGPSMARLIDVLRVFAAQEETVLISGPTGTGKSRLARWCHARSPRSVGPFEALDLSSVPEDLQLGELFGWRKGAFTGALRDNPGLISRAAGGTLFIDEIDKLSLRAQAGLLHVLEERTYRVLGEGAAEKTADVRFVVGTNADLRGEVAAGRFREDLYYRVHVLPIALPPLKERPDEIGLWARYMLRRRHADAVPDGSAQLSEAAERALASRPWPGNLRQLDNIIRRAYSLAVMAHQGKTPRAITLEEKEVAAALGLEGARQDGGVVGLMEKAAAALASRARQGPELDLDLADAFKGLLLAAAVEAAGGRDEAFKALGREALVRNRNHHKVLKRELERVEALCRALGEPVPAAVKGLLDQGEK